MFKIKIAELIFEIDNKYEFVEKQCRAYKTDEEKADELICVDDGRIQKEKQDSLAANGQLFSEGYLESVCIYREICMMLPKYDAFLLHASVIECDGQAYAFSAKSGTGKSTHTQLWLDTFGERARIINGDKPILRFVGGRLMVYGTPWCGKEGYNINTSSPFKALCFINRGEKNEIHRADAALAVTRVFHQVLIPKDEENTVMLLDLLDRMISEYPVYELYCNISKEAAIVAFEGMNK